MFFSRKPDIRHQTLKPISEDLLVTSMIVDLGISESGKSYDVKSQGSESGKSCDVTIMSESGEFEISHSKSDVMSDQKDEPQGPTDLEVARRELLTSECRFNLPACSATNHGKSTEISTQSPLIILPNYARSCRRGGPPKTLYKTTNIDRRWEL